MLIVGHSCVLSWWHAVKGKPAPNEMNRYWYEVERGLQAARRVVAPSRAMMLVLQYHYGPLPNCRVIPNGRAGHEFSPAAKEPFILSAGRMWDEAKNVEALAEVAPRLTWPVYIAGEEKHPSGFSALHHEHVHILGLLSPPMLAQWYSHAAIYALPARYEPFGLSALEAALAGCALVLGDIPTLRELWNEAALFVAPEDREGLAAALNALAADEPRRRELADKARARALEYPPQRMALGYLDAYRDIMSYQNSDREFAGTTG
jgi:glycosyltransferase involved in cell wall biosynthesis